MPSIIMLAGPPGAGKTTIARALAAAWPGPLVKLEGDTFWHFLSKPLEVEVRENFRLLMRSMTAACVPFAKGGYDVLLEFSIPPGFLKTARTIVKDLDLHYVLLRPSREVCEARAASREEWPIEDYEKLRAFYERFEGQEQHLVADEDADVAAIAERVRTGLAEGRFRVPL